MGRSVGADKSSQFPKVQQKTNLRVEDLGGDMYLVPGCLTESESRRFIETAERLGFQHQGSRGAAYGEAFRDNDRVAVDDPGLAAQLWTCTGLAAAVGGCLGAEGEGQAVGLNPNIRFYRYNRGQRFGRHIDESVELGGGRYTGYTLLIYLSTPSGGETVFYGGRGRKVAAVAPRAGLALLHRHEPDCMEHEAAAVKGGVKYVLRSDVVFQQ